MKKILSILIILLVLLGCSEKQSDTIITDESVKENFNLEDYKSFKVESNLTVEAYYDESYNVVYYTIANNETDEEIDLDLIGKTVEESVNLILEDIPAEETIKITSDDETVDEIVKSYLEENALEQEVLLNNEDITIKKSKLLNFDSVGEYGALIYKSYEWKNRRSECTGITWSEYNCDVFVFADDHTGFRIKYVNIGRSPVDATFTWDEEGNINYDNEVLGDWYKNGEISYHYPYFGSDNNYLHERFEVQEDGTIKDIICESTNEYMMLEKIDDFSAPWNTKDYVNNTIGKTIEEVWVDGAKKSSVWYEPSFTKYSDDYNGVKKYSTTVFANYPE